METEIVFTCQDNAYDLCIRELKVFDPNIKLVKWLERGTGIILAPGLFSETAEKLINKPPIFLRHIFPLEYSFSFEWPISVSEYFTGMIRDFTKRLDKTRTFSVQARFLDNGPINHHDIGHAFAGPLKESGFLFNAKSPEQVISIVIKDNQIYCGLSEAKSNLSPWPGGMRRFARTENHISRGGYKLLEALEVFNINLFQQSDSPEPFKGHALDLGAAPGGWSSILLDKGYTVTTVDPGDMHTSLAQNPRLTHFKGSVQAYAASGPPKENFDLILNDMRADGIQSAEIMAGLRDLLKPGGHIIMTLKLPGRKQTAVIKKSLSVLEKAYKITHARQLFHNRSEITVAGEQKQVPSRVVVKEVKTH